MPGYFSELSVSPYPLFPIPFNYLDSNILPFTSTWNMVKDTPKNMPDNMIG